jgi:alpha-N-acetylglucosamine transferase
MHVVQRDIVSQIYLDAFERLGARVRVIDPIEDTKYTRGIPGGRNSFWGMSFNKLRIFGYTEYRKILFIDADVMVLRNIDHVLLEPGFTAAFTTECCNRGARAKLGGGMWVFEPSAELWNTTQELIKGPCPNEADGTWVHADMDVVNFLFNHIVSCSLHRARVARAHPLIPRPALAGRD